MNIFILRSKIKSGVSLFFLLPENFVFCKKTDIALINAVKPSSSEEALDAEELERFVDELIHPARGTEDAALERLLHANCWSDKQQNSQEPLVFAPPGPTTRQIDRQSSAPQWFSPCGQCENPCVRLVLLPVPQFSQSVTPQIQDFNVPQPQQELDAAQIWSAMTRACEAFLPGFEPVGLVHIDRADLVIENGFISHQCLQTSVRQFVLRIRNVCETICFKNPGDWGNFGGGWSNFGGFDERLKKFSMRILGVLGMRNGSSRFGAAHD